MVLIHLNFYSLCGFHDKNSNNWVKFLCRTFLFCPYTISVDWRTRKFTTFQIIQEAKPALSCSAKCEKIQLILRNRAKDEKVDYKNLRRGKYQVKAMLNAILKGKSQVWNKILNSSSLTALELGRRKGFSLNKHKRRESCCSEGEKIIFCISIYFMRWQREGFERDQQRDDMK